MNSLRRLQLAVFTEVAERSRPASNQPLAADRKWPRVCENPVGAQRTDP